MLPLVAPEHLAREQSASEVRERLSELSERWKAERAAPQEQKPHADFVIFSTQTDHKSAQDFLTHCEASVLRVLGGNNGSLIVDTSLTTGQPRTTAALTINDSGISTSAKLLGLSGVPTSDFCAFLARRAAHEFELLMLRTGNERADFQVSVGETVLHLQRHPTL